MLNRDWHDAHRMPANASLDERIAWHVAHAQNCGCREMPESIKQALTERGIPLPQRRQDQILSHPS